MGPDIQKEAGRGIFQMQKEQRELKKKAKAQEAQPQLPQVEPVPLTIEEIEEDLSQGLGDRPEPIRV
jgi:hypothetical protein